MKLLFILSIPILLVVIFYNDLKTKVLPKVLSNILPTAENQNFLRGLPLRGNDTTGHGHFGADRGYYSDGTKRYHKGLDIKTHVGETINAPFDCYVNRIGYPYANDLSYRLIEVIGTNSFNGFKAKIMYCTPFPNVPIQKNIKQGTPIGIAQNISAKYDLNMINHVHFELYDNNGILTNPEQYV